MDLALVDPMLKNYFTLAYRSLLKNKVASLVSMLGLSVAIGCAIVAYMFISRLVLSESLHEHADTIFQIQTTQEQEGETFIYGRSPDPLGPQLMLDHPKVVRSVRLREAWLTVYHNESEFGNVFRFVDPEYLHMFTIPLKYGNPDVLRDPAALVLREDVAIKYFGDTNPVGQTLTVQSNSGELRSYVVKGVAESFPMQSVANFPILLAYSNYIPLVPEDISAKESLDWSDAARSTFIQLAEASDRKTIESALEAYVEISNANVEADTRILGYRLDNLSNLVFSAYEVRNPMRGTLPMGPIILLSTIALFLFTLACVNYINISLGAANTRVKEIGIRKVIGSRKRQLVAQFLIENLLLCFLALIAGIILAVTLLLPGFGIVTGDTLELKFGLQRIDLWYFLAGTLILTALVSGAYPAFYVASFKPVAIFTGTFKSGGPNRFMQTLLTGQFILAFVTMIVCVGFTQNLSYLKNVDWGYDNQHTLVVRLDPEEFDFMYDEASRLSQVEYVAGARTHLGVYAGDPVDISREGVEKSVVQFIVGEQYFDVTRPRLTAGVYPSLPGHILINTSLADQLGPDNVIGQSVTQEENEYVVSGIVEDFHYYNFSSLIEPAMFVQGDVSEFRYLLARIHPGAEEEVVSALAKAMSSVNPESGGLDYYFQDESFQRFFEEGFGINLIFYFTAIVALLLSCAGLFGLVAQHTSSKMKEMSIRKILGATVMQIVQLGNQKFVIILLISAIIASPLSYFLLFALLDSFIDYRMTIGPTPFVIAITLTLLLAVAVIATQARKLIMVNPAELLRYE